MKRTLFEAWRDDKTYSLILIEEIDQFYTRLYDVKGFDGDDLKVQFPPTLVKLSYTGLMELLQKFYVKLVKRQEMEQTKVIIWFM